MGTAAPEALGFTVASPPAAVWPSRGQRRGREGRPEWWGHSSDLEAWRKCGDNRVAREHVPTVPAPLGYSLLKGLEQGPREFRVKHVGLGKGQNPLLPHPEEGQGTLWVGQAAGTGQASKQWGGSRRKGLGGVPLSRGLREGPGSGGASGAQQRKGHSVGPESSRPRRSVLCLWTQQLPDSGARRQF